MTYLKFVFWIVSSQVLLGGPLAKVRCTGIQGISAQLPGGSIGQSWVYCIQGISIQFPGGPSPKVCSSAKYEHTSKLPLTNFQCNCLQEIHSYFGGSIGQSKFVCQFWCTSIKGISTVVPGGGVHWPKMTSSWALDVTHQLHWQ